MGMAELLQKVNRNEKSICGKCSHRFVCFGIKNQPCFECNRFEEEVVYCKDCLFWAEYESSLLGKVMCCTGQGCVRIEKKADDFCSYGERRTDGN